MPPRNKPRHVYAEENLARRIASEREARGWTYDGLAARMTAAECPIDQSAIYKIERGYKVEGTKAPARRRISVDELIGFSRVFGIGVEDLLLDQVLAERQVLGQLLERWRQLERERLAAVSEITAQLETVEAKIRELADGAPERVQAFVREYLRGIFRPGSHWVEDLTDHLTKEAGHGEHREEG
jgi:transcriptional regulator with XRE-family HTH domain